LPVSELNRLRREIAVELERQRTQPNRWTLCSGGTGVTPVVSGVAPETGKQGPTAPSPHYHPQSTSHDEIRRDAEFNPRDAGSTLIALVRNLPQLEVALSCGVTTIYCEFEDPKKYREAVTRARDQWRVASGANSSSPVSRHPSPAIFVAPPRIFKPGEEWTLEQVRSCNADGYLVRNYDHLKFYANDRRIGDYSLNVANRLAADYFKNQFGLERVTTSYDLNFQQLEALLSAAPPEWFEVTIHQHMPMFHMEHCVFCAFLSTGTDYRNCGRPCDVHDVRLRDRVGAEHPLKARHGLPQYGVQLAGADRRGVCFPDDGTRRTPFPRGIPERNAGAGDGDHFKIPPALAGRNHRHPALARIETDEPARCDARSNRKMSRLRLLSRSCHPSPQNYQSVAHPECQHDIRCGEIYFV